MINQCNYASSDPSTLSKHLKTHSGEKSNKCNQCDFSNIATSEKSQAITSFSIQTSLDFIKTWVFTAFGCWTLGLNALEAKVAFGLANR